MEGGHAELVNALGKLISRVSPGAILEGHKRLSGGASQETWQLDIKHADSRQNLILRRTPGGTSGPRAHGPGLHAEAELMRRAGQHGVPAPSVLYSLKPQDGLGAGFVMTKVDGETIARKILRDERFARVRPTLARRCGEILAAIHRIPVQDVPPLWRGPAATRLLDLRTQYHRLNEARPIFELAFRWLRERTPADPSPLCLVHGDFRNGNLIIDEHDIAAVLDWELAHLGDPIEDLGWLCVPSWRFGELDKEAGGFGPADELIAGYEATGGATVDRRALKFWTVFGTLYWGVTCIEWAQDFLNGDRSVERAAIGRRTSEVEIDLLYLIESGDKL